MTGSDLNAGAVATLKTIKNPISAARAVMEKSNHVFLSGKGAENFAVDNGLETVNNNYFITEKQLNQIRKIKENKYGTVGCVALDKSGNITNEELLTVRFSNENDTTLEEKGSTTD